MANSEPESSRTPQRRPFRCWAGFHQWRPFKNARWYCRGCPATKSVDPRTGKSVVETNESYGKW